MWVLEQGCACFLDGKCSVYTTWRPARCGSYTCRVLDSYLDGSRSLAQCLQIIDEMRGLAAERAASGPQVDVEAPAGADGLAHALFAVVRRKHFHKLD